jgi:SAM-dependent methyltransferase
MTLGFDSVESMDITPLEGATIVHDLSEPAPENLRSTYDMIYDGGTCEHIFDTHIFFRNIDTMLKPGGLIVHESPTNNFVNHGFYQLSPTLFDDVYTANNYEILEISMYYYLDPSQVLTHPPMRIPYARNSAPMVGKFPVLLATFVAARKSLNSNGFIKPHQGFYKRQFNLP